MTLKIPSLCKEIFDRSKEVIPGGVNSPVRAFIGLGIDPLVVEKGKGDTITDVDGRTFIDYCMSWGALLHGHAHEEIVKRGTERLAKGSSFGIATEGEEKLARMIVEGVKSIDQVRFVSSGTEATMTAVRLARGYTSRPIIIKFNGNYHGHADGFLVKAGSGVAQFSNTSSSSGVPKEVVKNTLSLPYNDIETFKKVMRDPFYSQFIAAVILEPIAANMGVVPSTQEFLEEVRKETERVSAVLIFDEVITGFRVRYGGAQELFGITPDLTCFGKIIGGGFPAAAFGGKREIMEHLAPNGKVYQAGTLSGNPVAMEGGLATLEIARAPHFYETLEKKTQMITKPVQEALLRKNQVAVLQESTGMFTLFWGVQSVSSFEDLKDLDKERFNEYFHFMLDRGIYLSPSPYEACFISAAHTEAHLEKTRDAILEFIERC
ncbi:MAG: glutamate-1-semialdehyde 2,1-aminomutase [Chlamydiia bacterium]|nr:glutamate-1-semialdehyde 2,1-aminomutase [Chlamydiia bacterium]